MKKFTRIIAVLCLVAFTIAMAACSAKEVEIGGLEDLEGKVIGVQLGTTGDTLTDDIDTKKVERYNAYVDAITSLKQKKIDAIIMDNDTATAYVAQNDDLMILDVGFEPEQYAVAVQKGDSELKAVVDKVIAEMKADGSLEASLEAHKDETGTAPDMNEGAPNGKLVMGTEAGFPPYEYLSGNAVIGTDIDLMARVAKELDMELVVENMLFDGLIAALQQGKIDAIAAGMTINEERQVNVDFSAPYVDASQVVVIRKASLK